MRLEKSILHLKDLETFDKNVFVGDNLYNQSLCNLILAISLIWNDTKNLSSFYEHIKTLEPKGVTKNTPEEMLITPFFGEYHGFKIHIEKLLVAVIHELFLLIRNSKDIIESPCFQHICKQMHKNCRESWQVILKYAFGGADKKTPLGKALLMVRHKIANHYDKDELFKGYKRKFLSTNNIPYISRGNMMCETRFYFADASAQEYYRSFQEKMMEGEFYNNLNLIITNINLALQNIVDTFIQKRSAWRSVK